MSRGQARAGGKGKGSPLTFQCPAYRRLSDWQRSGEPPHLITLTGQTKPFRGQGMRSHDTAREYDCSCGHHGWSAHRDLRDMAERESSTEAT